MNTKKIILPVLAVIAALAVTIGVSAYTTDSTAKPATEESRTSYPFRCTDVNNPQDPASWEHYTASEDCPEGDEASCIIVFSCMFLFLFLKN